MQILPSTLVLCSLLTASLNAQDIILTPGEYDAAKAAGTLPPGAIVMEDRNPGRIPVMGSAKGGGEAGCSCWIEPDADYTLAMLPNDDASSEMIDLPFDFTLYGDIYSNAFINNNGNVSFVTSQGEYTSAAFPLANIQMVAPFWADVDTRAENGGAVWYRLTSTALYVNWVGVGYFNQQTDKLNTFQVIITDGTDPIIAGGKNVSFCYKDMQWTTGAASDGTDGFGGIHATVGGNRGSNDDHFQIGRFRIDDAAYNGPYGIDGGVHWLDSMRFDMSTMDTIGIPPIFGTSLGCDTLIIEAGSTGEFQLMLMAGAVGQTVTYSSVSPTLASYEQEPAGIGSFVPVVFSLSPSIDDVGLHAITFTGVTVEGPELSSVYVQYVQVVDDLLTSVSEIAYGQLTVFPVPARDHISIKWPVQLPLSEIAIYDAQGRMVQKVTLAYGSEVLVLDISTFEAGAYWAQGTGSGVRTSAMFTIEN